MPAAVVEEDVDPWRCLGVDLLSHYHTLCDQRNKKRAAHSSHSSQKKQEQLFEQLANSNSSAAAAATTTAAVDVLVAHQHQQHLQHPPPYAQSLSLLYALLSLVDPTVGLLSDADGERCLEMFGRRAVASLRDASGTASASASCTASSELVCALEHSRSNGAQLRDHLVDAVIPDAVLAHTSAVLGVHLHVRRPDGRCDSYQSNAADAAAALVLWDPEHGVYAPVCFPPHSALRGTLAQVQSRLCREVLAERPGMADPAAVRRLSAAEVRELAASMALLPGPQKKKPPTKTPTKPPTKAVLLQMVADLVADSAAGGGASSH